ncbi:hypothetical protein VMCG_02428 [Cytospora schulzeri]|uniref:Zinc knuckle CX2CX3GHX4C domain-containing protein n=1 Tax=Cytospora schulzeri TaxID=448051 RepID=A0A423X0U8_9PEZI|nr:hypothetical protein VMCG_02428 [Valsa malicola]
MDQDEMGQQGSKETGLDRFRGVTMEELDKHVQAHGQDVLNNYLGWLQEQLNDWDLSDTAVFRTQIGSWCACLRLRGFDNQTIFDAFCIWKQTEIDNNASSVRRFLVAEEVLLEALSLTGAIEQSSEEVEYGLGGVITVQDSQVIDVSSGAEDSDVEFLGWKNPNNTKTGLPRSTGANKDNQMMLRSVYDDRNAGSKLSKTRKKSTNQQRKGSLPRGYVCKRCNEKGHAIEVCPTNLDPSYDRPPPNPAYECHCCGAHREHLTTLCPHNRNPDSLTQQRIRAGIITREPTTSTASNSYRPVSSNSRKREREPNASKSGIKTGSNRASRHSPPPAKRNRTRDERKHESLRERARRRSHKSYKPRGQSPATDSEYGLATELLPQVVHHSSEKAGRLSPWDEECGDSNVTQPASSLSELPVTSEFWRLENPDTSIQFLFPDADPLWVSDMTSFDVDMFFDELNVYMANRSVARDIREMQADPGLKTDDADLTVEVGEAEGQGTSRADSSMAHGVGSPFLDNADSTMYMGFN